MSTTDVVDNDPERKHERLPSAMTNGTGTGRRKATTTRRKPATPTTTDILDEIAAPIKAAWNKAVTSIFEAGGLLVEAREKLTADQFRALIGSNFGRGKLPFTWSTAYKLMKLAEHKGLQDLLAHVPLKLPPSWGTLHEMTLLSDEEFAYAVESDLIRPDMKRSDVNAMRQVAKERCAIKRKNVFNQPLTINLPKSSYTDITPPAAGAPALPPASMAHVPVTEPEPLYVVSGTTETWPPESEPSAVRDRNWVDRAWEHQERQEAVRLVGYLRQYHDRYPRTRAEIRTTIKRLCAMLMDEPPGDPKPDIQPNSQDRRPFDLVGTEGAAS